MADKDSYQKLVNKHFSTRDIRLRDNLFEYIRARTYGGEALESVADCYEVPVEVVVAIMKLGSVKE